MSSDKLVRATGYAAIFAVSAVAALLSYWHAVAVVGAHGEPGVYGHLYPATIDGLVVAASMVLLDSARRKVKAPRLAWVLIWSGITVTLGANVLNGISYGFLGSVIAAWPAAAFVGAYEMIMVLIRSHAGQGTGIAETAPTVAVELPQPGTATEPMEPPAPREIPVSKPPWEESPDFPGTFQPVPRRDDTQAVPVMQPVTPPAPQAVPESGPVGEVRVQSPLSRLDRKVPMDFRQTGSWPAVKE